MRIELQAQPFYESLPTTSRPRILLLSENFPPAQTAGSLRWEKFANALIEGGFALDVLTTRPKPFGPEDRFNLDRQLVRGDCRLWAVERPSGRLEGIANLVSAAVRKSRGRYRSFRGSVHTPRPARVVPPYRPGSIAATELRWIPRGAREAYRTYNALAHYEAGSAWVSETCRVALPIIGQYSGHCGVISSGPPHLAHLAARKIARETGLPFAIDLRDPWSLPRRVPEAHASPAFFALARLCERPVVESAAVVIVNTESVRLAMSRRYPHQRQRIITITNGFDAEALPDEPTESVFTIRYAGAIYLDRDPRPLFESIADFMRVRGLRPENVRLELIGAVDTFDGVPVRTLAQRAGLEAVVQTRPKMSRDELRPLLMSSHVLVSLPQDSEWAIPSKVFEYMPFRSHLLLYGEEGSPIAHLLRGTDIPVVSKRDVGLVADMLGTWYDQFIAGETTSRRRMDKRFSRDTQAEILVRHLARAFRR